MINCIHVLLFMLFIVQSISAIEHTDSLIVIKRDTGKTKISRQLYLSSNFQQLTNFHNENNLNIDITTRFNLTRNKSSIPYNSKQEINLELSFTKYIDSIVEVRDDEIELRSNWEFRFSNVLNSININIKSQMTNAYEYAFLKNDLIKILSKQPLLPAIFSIGTGFNFTFKKDNLVNFSPFDVKTTFLSDKISPYYPKHKKLSLNFNYLTEIGSSITISINKSWAKDLISWRNSSRVFIKGLTKDDTTLSSKNRIMYILFKSINISFENQMLYDPIYNYKLQLRNAIVLGVVFRK